MRNRTYGGVGGRKTKVGETPLRFPPTRFCLNAKQLDIRLFIWGDTAAKGVEVQRMSFIAGFILFLVYDNK